MDACFYKQIRELFYEKSSSVEYGYLKIEIKSHMGLIYL